MNARSSAWSYGATRRALVQSLSLSIICSLAEVVYEAIMCASFLLLMHPTCVAYKWPFVSSTMYRKLKELSYITIKPLFTNTIFLPNFFLAEMWYFCTSLAALALFTSANCSCNYGTSHFPREASVPVNNFSYTGLTGPLNWYALNKTANVLCSTGTQQSPIDIGKSSGVRIAPGSSIQISIPDYPSGALFENLGTTVEVVVNGTMVEHRKIYNLSQFHFHTPSEHRIDDEYFALEMHFVFEAAGIIVLSQFLKPNHIMPYN